MTEEEDYSKIKYYTVVEPPPTIGFLYLTSDFGIGFSRKPSWFHRKMVEWILGFKYEFEPTK